MSNVERNAVTASSRVRPLWARILCRWADKIAAGHLAIHFPDGSTHYAQGAQSGPTAILIVRSPKLVMKLFSSGNLGFARAYIEGDWDSPDIGAVLQLGIANEKALTDVLHASAPARLSGFLRHKLRANTRAGSRRNIAFHYDLGNDFYRLWLDETMTYSSAIFLGDQHSLADAQRAKYRRIIQELAIGPDDHVLEIGCGWGGFAEYAAAETGCRVTGLTLSQEQAEFAQLRLERAGLNEKVEIRLEDYRDCRGQFDKIVSIEMFEAVGEENWPIYFKALRSLLKPSGRAMVQSITIADDKFAYYRRNADFIQTYIFPGGMLPSPSKFVSVATETGLEVIDQYYFGMDYEKTLLAWEKAFVAAWNRIESLGFDGRFKRMWRYYLIYCATGFRSERIDVGQFLLARD